MLLYAKRLLLFTVTLVQKEEVPVSIVNARRFIKALGDDKDLRYAIGLDDTMLAIAKVYTKDTGLTEEEIEQAIKEEWGTDYVTFLSKACFSEVPGF